MLNKRWNNIRVLKLQKEQLKIGSDNVNEDLFAFEDIDEESDSRWRDTNLSCGGSNWEEGR